MIHVIYSPKGERIAGYRDPWLAIEHVFRWGACKENKQGKPVIAEGMWRMLWKQGAGKFNFEFVAPKVEKID